MAGVDLRTVQERGGWRTLGMVQRYAHLAPESLAAAVERIVAPASEAPPANRDAESPLRNFGSTSAILQHTPLSLEPLYRKYRSSLDPEG